MYLFWVSQVAVFTHLFIHSSIFVCLSITGSTECPCGWWVHCKVHLLNYTKLLNYNIRECTGAEKRTWRGDSLWRRKNDPAVSVREEGRTSVWRDVLKFLFIGPTKCHKATPVPEPLFHNSSVGRRLTMCKFYCSSCTIRWTQKWPLNLHISFDCKHFVTFCLKQVGLILFKLMRFFFSFFKGNYCHQ